MEFERFRVEAPMACRAVIQGISEEVPFDRIDRALAAGAGIKVPTMLEQQGIYASVEIWDRAKLVCAVRANGLRVADGQN